MERREFTKKKVHQRYYNSDGDRLPGVTTVIGRQCAWGKDALIHWAWQTGTDGEDYRAKRDHAADIGSVVHFRIEADLKGFEAGLDEVAPEVIRAGEPAYQAWQQWRGMAGVELVGSEVKVESDRLQVGGMADCIVKMDGVPWLLDWKTSKGVYPEHWLQLSAYTHMWMEETGQELAGARLVHLDKHSGNMTPYYKTTEQLDPWFTCFEHFAETDYICRKAQLLKR